MKNWGGGHAHLAWRQRSRRGMATPASSPVLPGGRGVGMPALPPAVTATTSLLQAPVTCCCGGYWVGCTPDWLAARAVARLAAARWVDLLAVGCASALPELPPSGGLSCRTELASKLVPSSSSWGSLGHRAHRPHGRKRGCRILGTPPASDGCFRAARHEAFEHRNDPPGAPAPRRRLQSTKSKAE